MLFANAAQNDLLEIEAAFNHHFRGHRTHFATHWMAARSNHDGIS